MPLAWIQSVTADRLPLGPFMINHYTTVIDPARWLAVMQTEARIGPAHCRAKTGILQREIETVRQLIEGDNQW